jgi:hypothetical protein
MGIISQIGGGFMPPQDQLNGDPLTWLQELESPGVRYLALRDLLDCGSDDAEVRAARKAAHQHDPIATILIEMHPSGYWAQPGPGYLPKYRSTVWSIIMLAQLGASIEEDERIERACAYVLDQALTAGGQFTTSGTPSGTADCLQGNLCWALVELGCDDRRLDAAFEWLARSVTGEGVAPVTDKQAATRYYAGNWWKFSFPIFYVTDLLQNVEALAALGYGHDLRLKHAIQLIRDRQDDHGRWSLDYDYTGKTWVNFGPKKQPNKWVTLRALRVLKHLVE